MDQLNFIEQFKRDLFDRATRDLEAGKDFTLPVYLDLSSAISIIGSLQLALRHPANIGPSAKIARHLIDVLIAQMREGGFTAAAELAVLGDNPDFDEAQSAAGAGGRPPIRQGSVEEQKRQEDAG